MPPFQLQAPSVIGDTGIDSIGTTAKSLADTIVQGPARAAQAGYYGAEAGRAQAQTQGLQDALTAKGQLPGLLEAARTGGPTDMNNFRAAAARAGMSDAETTGALRGVMAQQQSANPVPQPQFDVNTTNAFGGNYGTTPSGVKEGYGKDLGVAGITAGATITNNRDRLRQERDFHNEEVKYIPDPRDPSKVIPVTHADYVDWARQNNIGGGGGAATPPALSGTIAPAPGNKGKIFTGAGAPAAAPGLSTPFPGMGAPAAAPAPGGNINLGGVIAGQSPAQQPTDPGAAAVAPPSQGSPPSTGYVSIPGPDAIKNANTPVQAVNPATGKVETISAADQLRNHWVSAADANTRWGTDHTPRIIQPDQNNPVVGRYVLGDAVAGQTPFDEPLSRLYRTPAPMVSPGSPTGSTLMTPQTAMAIPGAVPVPTTYEGAFAPRVAAQAAGATTEATAAGQPPATALAAGTVPARDMVRPPPPPVDARQGLFQAPLINTMVKSYYPANMNGMLHGNEPVLDPVAMARIQTRADQLYASGPPGQYQNEAGAIRGAFNEAFQNGNLEMPGQHQHEFGRMLENKYVVPWKETQGQPQSPGLGATIAGGAPPPPYQVQPGMGPRASARQAPAVSPQQAATYIQQARDAIHVEGRNRAMVIQTLQGLGVQPPPDL